MEPDTAEVRRAYDAYACDYDRETAWYDRVMLGDGREWACRQSRGRVLEVAIGTGRNLPFYPPKAHVTGVDMSRGMLAVAAQRAVRLGVTVTLAQGDAARLPVADATMDTVVCTLGLSSIPDDRRALREMSRVLAPGGRVILLGHVASPYRLVRAGQGLLQRAAQTRTPDQQTRSVTAVLSQAGLAVIYRRTTRAGTVERLVAVHDQRRNRGG